MVLRVVSSTLLAVVLLQTQSGGAPPSDKYEAALSQRGEDLTTEQPNPAAAAPAPSLANCAAGAPLGAVDLRVRSESSPEPLPFLNINHLSEGDTLLYAPVLRGHEKRPGEIALVLVPAKRQPKEDLLIVTEPKPADKPQEWKMSQTVSLAAFVYGPAGLSKRKVKGFLSQDDLLIAQLADYAEKTSQTEALVEALSNSESSSASVNAALTGFASQYGFSVQLDKNAPPSAQAEAVFASMNPQLASYNPLVSSTAARAGQTTSLATAAATLFFGSPVGLAAGGTAMLLDLRSIAFPDTQFRSSFVQQLPNSGLNLCGQRSPTPPHTRAAFIWASRIPNVHPPTIRIGDADFIPAKQKTPVPVDVPDADWKFVQRARAWALEDTKSHRTVIPLLKLGNQRALELDLSKADLQAGDYHLTGYWDWTRFETVGQVHVRPLSDFKQAKLEAASQDRLAARAGKIPVTFIGSDFEFTTGVQLKKLGDEFATAEPVRFILPKGLREGPQDRMDVQIDTDKLDSGKYEVLITQQDGEAYPVSFKVLPNPPKISNLPILANQGQSIQHFVLKGERLDSLSKLDAPGAVFELGAVGAGSTERNVTVQLKSNPQQGTLLPVKEYVEDRSQPLLLSDGFEITGPLPVIASSKLSLPIGMAITIGSDEFPAGYTLTAVIDVKNSEPNSVLRLECSDGVGVHAAMHIGEQTPTWSLQQLSPDQLFLSFDTSAVPAGCSLQAVMDNGLAAKSQPATLAHVIRMPQIDAFEMTQEAPVNGNKVYTLTGHNLEMIQKVGWNQTDGVEVPGLPVPIPGQGQKQLLRVSLPDPPNAQAALYVWLRDGKEGRVTTITAPPSSATPPANAPTVNTGQVDSAHTSETGSTPRF